MKTRSGKSLENKGDSFGSDNNNVKNGTGSSVENKNKSTKDRTFYIVFGSLILDLLAFTVILPLLPTLLDYYSQNDQSGLYACIKNSVASFRDFVGAPDTPRWNSVLFGGLIGSLFSMLQFLTAPIVGAASDVYGRKPMMMICLVGIALSYVIWAISSNFFLFVIARIVGGISKGNVNLCTAIVTDVSTSQERGKGMAFIGVAFSIGFVFGPSIGAAFSTFAKDSQGEMFVYPALFALTLALADIVFVYFCLGETLQKQKRLPSRELFTNAVKYINPVSLFKFTPVQKLSAKESKEIRNIGAIYFIYLFIYSGLEFTLPFLMHMRFEYSSMQQGKMFFFMGMVMAFIQGGYTRKIPSGKEIKISSQGILLLIPAFLLMGLTTNIWLVYLGLTIFSFASATVVPCLTTLISTYGGQDEKGTLLGIFRSLGALSRAIGPLVISTVYWCVGAGVCYCIGAVSLSIPFYLLMKNFKPKSK